MIIARVPSLLAVPDALIVYTEPRMTSDRNVEVASASDERVSNSAKFTRLPVHDFKAFISAYHNRLAMHSCH